MKKLLSVFLFCCFFILIFFFLLQDFEAELFNFLESTAGRGWYSFFSFIILGSDIIMPIPSSLVMILNGKVLGLAGGTLLSTASGMFSSAVGFYLGRKSGGFLNRFFSSRENEIGSRFFTRYGRLAVIFSKALPIVSESVAFVSGTTAFSFRRYMWLSFIGHLGISTVYAYVGYFATTLDSGWASAGTIFLVLLLLWCISHFLQRKGQRV